MLLTRYELSFYGEPQNIGIIQGLKEQNLSTKTIDALIEQFNKTLMIPDFASLKPLNSQEYLASFFTPLGLSKFSKEIDKIIKFIEKKDNGWEVNTVEMTNLQEQELFYQDDFQVIISIPYK